jgi:RimJ/RimL family protein N-acetyltransferase/predicted N-acetyltransferase YhbS
MLPIHIDEGFDLRLFQPADAEGLYALIAGNRAHLDAWMRWSARVQTFEDSQAFIQRAAEHYASGSGFHAGLWLSDQFVGGFAVRDINRDSSNAEIGYWLGAEFVGQGLVTRACRAVIDQLFAQEHLHRIEIRAATDNRASRAVAERLGFTFEGVLRESEWITTSFRDHAVYSLLDREWLSQKQQSPFRIRPAQPADIPQIQDLIHHSVRGLSTEQYDAQQIESSLKYIFGVDTQLIEDGTYFVVEAGDQIVGSGGWSKRKTLYGGDQAKQTEDNLLDPAHDPARIRAFYVHPDWARRGVGRLIMTTCEQAAKQAGFTRLELVATLPGEPLYLASGFAVRERYNIDMPDGVPLPVAHMTKTI